MIDRPPVSALIATIRGWPIARPALERVVGQVVQAGGEVVVADGSDQPPPTPDELTELGGPVVWLRLAGRSVFQLRMAGYRAARGEILAVTEDHCFAAPDWVERILAAHREYPAAGAIGGAVLNGTDRKVVDWAAFVLTQGAYMPPFRKGTAARIAGPANVSYKRRVLERIGGSESQGVIDFLELPSALEGEQTVADDRIRVLHHQSQGIVGTSLAEFDNGRSIAGYRRQRMTRGDWMRVAAAPVLPVYRAIRALRLVARKPVPRDMLLRAVPVHVWLQYCAVAGELAGYLRGPGRSPHRLF